MDFSNKKGGGKALALLCASIVILGKLLFRFEPQFLHFLNRKKNISQGWAENKGVIVH